MLILSQRPMLTLSKLAPKWEGPVKIRKKLGPVNYLVEWGSGEKVDNVNVVNLKQYFWEESPD